jgi:hypothetical protein
VKAKPMAANTAQLTRDGRKIRQIAAMSNQLFVLCDDSTLWVGSFLPAFGTRREETWNWEQIPVVFKAKDEK